MFKKDTKTGGVKVNSCHQDQRDSILSIGKTIKLTGKLNVNGM